MSISEDILIQLKEALGFGLSGGAMAPKTNSNPNYGTSKKNNDRFKEEDRTRKLKARDRLLASYTTKK